MYQEGHISVDFNTKQAVMTLQKVEAKAKAPPPPLDGDESQKLTWKLADNIGNLAKADRAAKAAREAQSKGTRTTESWLIVTFKARQIHERN